MLSLAGLLLVTACSSGEPRPAQPAPTRPTTTPPPVPTAGPYVALGDSYTSGLQIEPQTGTPVGCARSAVNYPSLVAKRLGVTEFTDVSCSGARARDLTEAQRTTGGANPPQLDRLSAATRLVTVGIGGNDAGFMDVISRCAAENARQAVAALTGGLAGGLGAAAPCREYYTTGGGRDELQRKVDAAGDGLGKALQEIRRRAPQARVYVVGYPALLPADPAGCAIVLGQGVAGDVAFLGEKEQQLNGMLEQRAEAAGVGFVDTYTPSVGHDMCAGEPGRWIEPPMPTGGLAPLHPNAAGQQGMAEAVLKTMGAGR